MAMCIGARVEFNGCGVNEFPDKLVILSTQIPIAGGQLSKR